MDFYAGGHRDVDEQELDEFEPRFGDDTFCRACGFTWTYGHPSWNRAAPRYPLARFELLTLSSLPPPRSAIAEWVDDLEPTFEHEAILHVLGPKGVTIGVERRGGNHGSQTDDP